MKLLSIAIPCYNSENYMRKCIDSLLIGGEDVEIIIVDDGSTRDRTAEIADEYAAQFPTIVKAVHKTNGGHGSAVNAGIANATGLYFKVVDSDDWVRKDAYEKVLDKLLASLCGLYDYIIIDCGLKHELLTVNALAAADYCIIPVQAHFLASEGIPDVLEMVRNVQNRFNPDLKIAGILLTMYQSRPQLCQSVRSSVGEIYGDSIHVFDRPIEQTIKVAECPAAGMSILDYAPKNPAADSYRSLAQEVLRLG